MKLLTKSTVATEQAREKKSQIDEGLRIATKIDAMRQALADLESQYAKFAAGTKTEMERITAGLVEQIKSLNIEIAILELRRKALLEPLDAKWNEVLVKEQILDGALKAVETNKVVWVREKTKLDATNAKAKDSLFKIKVRERELTKVYVQADEALAEAEIIKSKLREEQETHDEIFKKRTIDLDNREKMIDFNAEANENMKKLLDEQEIDQNYREQQIHDKYQTLLRTTNRKKR